MYNFVKHFCIKYRLTAAIALLALLALFASSYARAQSTSVDSLGTVTEPLGENYTQPKKLDPNAARITFYRPARDNPIGVSSLQINEHYHGSLQFGSYSEICLPPGRMSLAAQMVQTGAPLKNFKDATVALSIYAGQNLYFRLNDNGDSRATITPVAADVALHELQNTRRQMHVVSRVPDAVNCWPREPRFIKKESIILGADALFAFGKSDIKGISPQGRASLDELIARLQKEYGNQDDVQIQIAGHADPLGNPASNKRLSEARAKALRTYMGQGGMKAQNITAVGVGDEQPVITTCGKTATPEAIECNKPNRRVVVSVQVTAR
jgi:outer membrane protein OmpA-like peptidoglycan-associated protein